MRIKVKKGSDPLGLATYLLNPDKQKAVDRDQGQSPILAKNMFGRDATQLAEEFRFSHDLNRRIKQTMVHYSISLPPGEQVDDPQKAAIAKDLLKQMGHDDCQYFVVAHHDQEHKRGVQHWHIATSAVNLDGQRVDDSYNYLKLKQVERDLEQRYQLQDCSPQSIAQQKNLTSGETRLKDRTGAILPKEKLWRAIDQAITDQPTMPVLLMRLKAQGIEVQFHERIEDNERKLGLSFGIDSSKFQGKRLGKAYSFSGLIEHRGLSYQADRDDELLRQLNRMSAEQCRSQLAQLEQPRSPHLTRELELIPTPASVTSQTETPTAQPETPAASTPAIPNFDSHAAARSMLQHFRQRFKREKRKSLTFANDRYSVSLDPESHVLTITDNSPKQKGKIIAQDEKTLEGWKVKLAQVTPEDKQNFKRYQRQYEKEQKQQER